MDRRDPVFAPRRATSRWTDASDYRVEQLASVEEVGSPALYEIDDPVQDGRFLPDADAKIVNIVLLKSQGVYKPVVDGVVASSRGNNPDLVRNTSWRSANLPLQVRMHTHRGIYRHPGTDEVLFSPCRVSVVLEDGERRPERITVAVVQQYALSATSGSIDRAHTLGEVDLEPTSVADIAGHGVFVPYPAPTTQPPFVTINDMSPIVQANSKKLTSTLWQTLPGLASIAIALYTNTDLLNPEAKRVAVEAAKSKAKAEAYKALSYWETRETADNMLREAAEKAAQDKQDEFTVGLLQRVTIPGALALLAIVSSAFGIPIGAAILTPISQVISKLAIEGNVDTVLAGGKIAIAGFSAFSKYITSPPKPEPVKFVFTIPDLIEVLRGLSENVNMTEADLRKAAENNRFKKERLLWNWLLTPESSLRVLRSWFSRYLSRTRQSLPQGLAGDPLFAEGLECGVGTCIQTAVRVIIEDSEGCGEDQVTIHDFICGREDAGLLGAAAAGTLEHLKELQATITGFEIALRRARASSFTGKVRMWSDWVLSGIYNSVKTVTGIQTSADTQRNRLIQEAVNLANKGLIETVIKNMPNKLYGFFMNPTSPGQSMILSLERRMLLFVPRPLSKPPSTPVYAVRTLPQLVSQQQLLYPQSQTTDTEFMDIDIGVATIREASPIGNAAKAYNTMSRTSRKVLAHMLRLWDAKGERPRLVLAHSKPAEWDDKHAMPGRRDHFALVFALPADILNETVMRPYKDADSMRLGFVARRGGSTSGQGPIGSVLEAFGVANTAAHAIAVQLIAELTVEELVSIAARSDDEPSLAVATQMMSPAIVRACDRALLVAETLQTVSTSSLVGPILPDDQSLRASRAGRDTALFVSRNRLYTLFGSAGIAHMKLLASALSQTARKLSSAPPFKTRLPSEPLSALYDDHQRAFVAIQRISQLVGGDSPRAQVTTALDSAALSYPWTALTLSDEQQNQVQPDPNRRTPLEVPPNKIEMSPASVSSAMRLRAAAMRMDHPTVDSLAARARVLNLYSPEFKGSSEFLLPIIAPDEYDDKSIRFYCPFGHGDLKPPLAFPSVPASMFASVPVWMSTLLGTLRMFSEGIVLQPDATDLDRSTVATLKPNFVACAIEQEAEDSPPSGPIPDDIRLLLDAVIQQSSSQEPTESGAIENPPEYVPPSIKPRHPLVFGLPPEVIVRDPVDGSTGTIRFLASVFNNPLGGSSDDLSSAVASMIWNAERMLQAQLLALAFTQQDVLLDIPTGVRPPQPQTDDFLTKVTQSIRELAREHYSLLRAEVLYIYDYATQSAIATLKPVEDDALGEVKIEPSSAETEAKPEIESVVGEEGTDDVEVLPRKTLAEFVRDVEPVGAFIPNGRPEAFYVKLLLNDNLPDADLNDWLENMTGYEYYARESIVSAKWSSVPVAIDNIPGRTQVTNEPDDASKWYTVNQKQQEFRKLLETKEGVNLSKVLKATPSVDDVNYKVRKDRSVNQYLHLERLRAYILMLQILMRDFKKVLADQKQARVPRRPVWDEHCPTLYILSAAVSFAMSKHVLHQDTNVTPVLKGVVSDELSDDERGNMKAAVMRCIKAFEGLADESGTASLRLGEVCAVLCEIASR